MEGAGWEVSLSRWAAVRHVEKRSGEREARKGAGGGGGGEINDERKNGKDAKEEQAGVLEFAEPIACNFTKPGPLLGLSSSPRCHPSVCILVCLLAGLFVCLYGAIFLHICLSAYLSACLPSCLTLCLPVRYYLFARLLACCTALSLSLLLKKKKCLQCPHTRPFKSSLLKSKR